MFCLQLGGIMILHETGLFAVEIQEANKPDHDPVNLQKCKTGNRKSSRNMQGNTLDLLIEHTSFN